MSKVKVEKLERCRICCVVPKMQRFSSAEEPPSRSRWWYKVECRGFQHTITITHKTKSSAARVWNMLNGEENQEK